MNLTVWKYFFFFEKLLFGGGGGGWMGWGSFKSTDHLEDIQVVSSQFP